MGMGMGMGMGIGMGLGLGLGLGLGMSIHKHGHKHGMVMGTTSENAPVCAEREDAHMMQLTQCAHETIAHAITMHVRDSVLTSEALLGVTSARTAASITTL